MIPSLASEQEQNNSGQVELSQQHQGKIEGQSKAVNTGKELFFFDNCKAQGKLPPHDKRRVNKKKAHTMYLSKTLCDTGASEMETHRNNANCSILRWMKNRQWSRGLIAQKGM